MGERISRGEPGSGSQEWHQEASTVADALRRGTLLTVSATSGAQSRGYVCDRDGLGLLLDLHSVPGGETAGYEFFPWTSVEHPTIHEARHLRTGGAALHA